MKNLLIIIIIANIYFIKNSNLKKTELIIDNKRQCGSFCLKCIDTENNICKECEHGTFNFNNNCYLSCPDGTYLDKDWKECRKCHVDCPVCWGSNNNMCGTKPGMSTEVVILENEIRSYFSAFTFSQAEIEQWVSSLKVVFKNGMNQDPNNMLLDTLSTTEVYSNENIEVNLPIGSFSSINGVFIPIPSYFNTKGQFISSHWVYRNGMWDGKNWNEAWFPRLPSFIKYKGNLNKIYFENNGYWVYNTTKEWYWIKSSSLKELVTDKNEIISNLNHVKIDVIYKYNFKAWGL